ncbi:hypothetical protein T01_12715 [Trichinella spiralis]|uniref:Uncharacterized protein n=1 Tax=Trichinella spiralis TaxID=6334 RepID=A0A0V1AN66_TRISP|nr:hypothetical protein T01_12715 [Trichinella spiralis]
MVRKFDGWGSQVGTLALVFNKNHVFHTKSSLSISTTRGCFLVTANINDEIYTSVLTTDTFICSIFLIIWLLLETAVSKLHPYCHSVKLSLFELVMASRFLTLENAIDYLETLPPEEQINAEVCQLPPCEDGNLTDQLLPFLPVSLSTTHPFLG